MMRLSASSRSLFIVYAASLAGAGLLLPGCGARADGGVSDNASPRQGAAQRTREGRAGQLLQLAREVGAAKQEPALADAGGSEPSSSADAGSSEPAQPAVDAEPGDGGSALDAGSPPLPPPPPPPPPLPRDIVEQSALPLYGLEAGVVLTEAALWDRLAASAAVCFGELHDVAAHHYAETRALGARRAREQRRASLRRGFRNVPAPLPGAPRCLRGR